MCLSKNPYDLPHCFEPARKAFLLSLLKDTAIHSLDEKRYSYEDGYSILFEVLLDILKPVAEYSRCTCSKHDNLTCKTEGVVIWQKRNIDICVINLLRGDSIDNIRSNITLRKHYNLRLGCSSRCKNHERHIIWIDYNIIILARASIDEFPTFYCEVIYISLIRDFE